MEKSEKKWSGMYGILVAGVVMGLSLFLCPVPTQAGVVCSTSMSSTTDFDGDGFTDYQECYGITLKDNKTDIPGRTNCNGQTNCLDPDTKDIFVILVPAATDSPMATLINAGADPLEFVVKPQASGGLGLKVHQITASQADSNRYVTLTQKAIRVTENVDGSASVVLGMSSCGTPNGLDAATIYTKRIINQVLSITKTTSATVDQNLVNNYIKQTIAHEIGHMVGPLAPTYNANYGGYHYKSGTNVIMDQSVFYKGTTLYIGKTYTAADQSKINLLK